MTRNEWLKQLNDYGYAIGIDYKEAQALPLIAEYDRLTAELLQEKVVKAQLITALEACLPVMAELHDWRMAQEAIPLVTAAIRAVKEEKCQE